MFHLSKKQKACFQDVVDVCLTECAVAAIKADGSVVTGGDDFAGGDVACVAMEDYSLALIMEKQEALRDVVSITANSSAFAALRKDGKVIAWGDPASGGGVESDRLGELVNAPRCHVRSLAIPCAPGFPSHLGDRNVKRLLPVSLHRRRVLPVKEGVLSGCAASLMALSLSRYRSPSCFCILKARLVDAVSLNWLLACAFNSQVTCDQSAAVGWQVGSQRPSTTDQTRP